MSEIKVYKKFDLNQTDVLINGRQIITIDSIEWVNQISESDTLRNGKIVSTASRSDGIRGKIVMEQSEKLLVAEELGAKDGNLTSKICDLVGYDQEGRHFVLKRVRFGNDGYRFSRRNLDDRIAIDFVVLGAIEFNSKS